MTRDSDIRPTGPDWIWGELLDPKERVSMLRTLVKDEGVDYFLSIHCNSYVGSGRAWGPRIYHYNKNGAQTADLATAVAKGIYSRLSARNPQVNSMNEGAFEVIRHSLCPALLIEVGFVTDEKEAASMKIDGWQENMAQGIADGLIAHIRERNPNE
jgi:N-acetylmuramoyl-L-alanine amidase